jgi:hypothetical protein
MSEHITSGRRGFGKAWRGFDAGRMDCVCTIFFLGSGYTLVVRTSALDKYDSLMLAPSHLISSFEMKMLEMLTIDNTELILTH